MSKAERHQKARDRAVDLAKSGRYADAPAVEAALGNHGPASREDAHAVLADAAFRARVEQLCWSARAGAVHPPAP